jgi:hypothetical protein
MSANDRAAPAAGAAHNAMIRTTPRAPVLAPEHHWRCPECLREKVTRLAKPHSPLHQCPKLRGAWAPFVLDGIHARLETVERGDYVGTDLVTCDGNGRPVMAVVTRRNDGEDRAIFAPCATAKIGDYT